jgi:hypothetical protein
VTAAFSTEDANGESPVFLGLPWRDRSGCADRAQHAPRRQRPSAEILAAYELKGRALRRCSMKHIALLTLLVLGCRSSLDDTRTRFDPIIGGKPSDKKNTGTVLLGTVPFGSASCVTIDGKRYILSASHNFNDYADLSTTPPTLKDTTIQFDEGGPSCKLESVYLSTTKTAPTSDATLGMLDLALAVPSGCELTDEMCPPLSDKLPEAGATCEVYGIRCADANGTKGDADRKDIFVTTGTLSGVFGGNGFFLEGLTNSGDSGGVVVCNGVVVGVVRSGVNRDGKVVATFVAFITADIAKQILAGTWKGMPLDDGTYQKILDRARKEGVARTEKCTDEDAGTDGETADTDTGDTGVNDTSFDPEVSPYPDFDYDGGMF